MPFQESETVELKEIVVEDLKKEVIAFANSAGGTVYVGVTDDGSVVGVDSPDQAMQQVANMVRNSIKPDVTMLVRYEAKQVDGKTILSVEVQRGTDRPYYLAKKGLRPEGVYVRQGTSSVPATDAAIRRMIKDTDGDSFENMRSLEQELTFEATKEEFQNRKLAFDQPQMKTLGILNTDGIYTNLGLLLSEQCAHTVKAAVFEGTDQSVFRDRQEFAGSLLKQLNDVYEFIDRRNQVHSTFDKLRRIDERDYPEVAIREALLNSLVHRDYAFSGPTLISIFEDRIEFVTIGGLARGIGLEDIRLGVSVLRNPDLANIFYRLRLIEAYGTGILRIHECYAGAAVQPAIEATDHAFKITLPNLNFSREAENTPPARPATSLGKREARVQKVIGLCRENGWVVRKDVEAALGVSQATAILLLREMTRDGLLEKQGTAKKLRYYLAET